MIMLFTEIYNYLRLTMFALSLISLAVSIYFYIRFDIGTLREEMYGRKKIREFKILQCEIEIHSGEDIWKE